MLKYQKTKHLVSYLLFNIKLNYLVQQILLIVESNLYWFPMDFLKWITLYNSLIQNWRRQFSFQFERTDILKYKYLKTMYVHFFRFPLKNRLQNFSSAFRTDLQFYEFIPNLNEFKYSISSLIYYSIENYHKINCEWLACLLRCNCNFPFINSRSSTVKVLKFCIHIR